jgi:hypothetical protein
VDLSDIDAFDRMTAWAALRHELERIAGMSILPSIRKGRPEGPLWAQSRTEVGTMNLLTVLRQANCALSGVHVGAWLLMWYVYPVLP